MPRKPKSPFASFANATLTFQIGDGLFANDPETGNPVEGSTTLKVIALLNPGSANPKYQAGVDESWEYMTGYMVDPLTPPPTLIQGLVGAAILKISPGVEVPGIFKLMPITNDPYVMGAGVEIVTEIKGLFRRQS